MREREDPKARMHHGKRRHKSSHHPTKWGGARGLCWTCRSVLGKRSPFPWLVSVSPDGYNEVLMWFGTHYSKIWQLGMLTVLAEGVCKKWKKQEGHSNLPPSLLKKGIKPSSENCLPCKRRKGTSLSLKTKDAGRNLNKQSWLRPPSSPHLSQTLSMADISPRLSSLHQTSHKNTQLNHFFGSLLSYKGSCVIKFLLNKFVCFSPVNLFLPA